MSVLLIGLGRDLGLVVTKRLVAQGDEVRVLLDEPRLAADYKAAGAYTALGHADDDDLIERAAQDVRTIVLGEQCSDEEVEAAVDAAARARVERIVMCRRGIDAVPQQVASSGRDFVILTMPPRRGFRRKERLSDALVAEAIDAADDLAGNPRLVLDLANAGAWEALNLPRP